MNDFPFHINWECHIMSSSHLTKSIIFRGVGWNQQPALIFQYFEDTFWFLFEPRLKKTYFLRILSVDPVEVRSLCETNWGFERQNVPFDRCITGITYVQMIFLWSFPDSNFFKMYFGGCYRIWTYLNLVCMSLMCSLGSIPQKKCVWFSLNPSCPLFFFLGYFSRNLGLVFFALNGK